MAYAEDWGNEDNHCSYHLVHRGPFDSPPKAKEAEEVHHDVVVHNGTADDMHNEVEDRERLLWISVFALTICPSFSSWQVSPLAMALPFLLRQGSTTSDGLRNRSTKDVPKESNPHRKVGQFRFWTKDYPLGATWQNPRDAAWCRIMII